MKRTIMFILLVLPMCINAQKYVPFPTENTQWNVFYASSLYGSPTDTTLLKYTIQSDTTINEVTYHKLCKNIGSDENPQYIFAGGLREQDKKIFFYGFGYSKSNLSSLSNKEYLLYDFNKKTGDSVMFDQERWYKIINIDSVKIGSSFRKRYQIRIGISPESEYIIEGIGNVNQGLLGMITPILTCLDCHFEWEFVCFSQNGESVYKNPAYVDCGSPKKWSEKKYLTDTSCWTNIYYNKYQYYLNGDTALNGKSYKKLFERTLLESSPGSGKTLYNIYQGAIREENGKIFAVLNNSSNNISGEFLLYDFTVGLGDTIKSNISKECGCQLAFPIVVTKIDTITLLNGEKRKKIQLNNASDWIEGIGSVNGLFYDALPLCTCIERPHLMCFKQNDVQLYAADCLSENCCDITDGINQIKRNSPSLKLSPSPVADISILKWDSAEAFTTLTITDLFGKVCKIVDIKGISETNINRSDFTKGLYIGRLVSSTGYESTLKIIIQ